ncbi:MAG: MopE-related protein [bacterium]
MNTWPDGCTADVDGDCDFNVLDLVYLNRCLQGMSTVVPSTWRTVYPLTPSDETLRNTITKDADCFDIDNIDGFTVLDLVFMNRAVHEISPVVPNAFRQSNFDLPSDKSLAEVINALKPQCSATPRRSRFREDISLFANSSLEPVRLRNGSTNVISFDNVSLTPEKMVSLPIRLDIDQDLFSITFDLVYDTEKLKANSLVVTDRGRVLGTPSPDSINDAEGKITVNLIDMTGNAVVKAGQGSILKVVFAGEKGCTGEVEITNVRQVRSTTGKVVQLSIENGIAACPEELHCTEEICDGKDNDCDGKVDEDLTARSCSSACGSGTEICQNGKWAGCTAPQPQTFYRDNDGDGYGNDLQSTQACSAPSGYVINKSDCNDTDKSIHPGAIEFPCNGKDDDCMGGGDDTSSCPGAPLVIPQFEWMIPRSAWYFDLPDGVAVDGGGNVYVADSYNDRIQKFDRNGTFLATWGSFGSEHGQFNYPSGIAVDGNGNVYVTDIGNNRIQKFDPDGTFLATWESWGSGDGQFLHPSAIAVDGNGNVYVVYEENHCIQKFDRDGTFLTRWGNEGSGDGQFLHPSGIAVDGSGNVYVADTGNNRIQKFDPGGMFLATWGSYGSEHGQFKDPSGIAVDGSGIICIADTNNDRIQKFTNGNDSPSRTMPVTDHKPVVSPFSMTIHGSILSTAGTAVGSGWKIYAYSLNNLYLFEHKSRYNIDPNPYYSSRAAHDPNCDLNDSHDGNAILAPANSQGGICYGSCYTTADGSFVMYAYGEFYDTPGFKNADTIFLVVQDPVSGIKYLVTNDCREDQGFYLSWKNDEVTEHNIDLRRYESKPLQQGWNFISFSVLKRYVVNDGITMPNQGTALIDDTGVPVSQSVCPVVNVTSIHSALSSLCGQWERIYFYDGFKPPGDAIRQTKFGATKDIKKVEFFSVGHGYWIYVPNVKNSELVVLGDVIRNNTPKYHLALNSAMNGLYMVGYWGGDIYFTSFPDTSIFSSAQSATPVVVNSIGEVFGSFKSSLSRVKSFYDGAKSWYNPDPWGLSDLTYIGPGFGYSMRITQDCQVMWP